MSLKYLHEFFHLFCFSYLFSLSLIFCTDFALSYCSAARCNSGQVVHTRVPLFTRQYKLVPASAGGKVHHRSVSADLAVGGQPAPLQHRSYLWLPLYSGLEVTCHLRRYINCRYFTFFYLYCIVLPFVQIQLKTVQDNCRAFTCNRHKTREFFSYNKYA